jgi:6-hydroxycyclohex-1-ene-1-carbonyl-CoA dehydrogenase
VTSRAGSGEALLPGDVLIEVYGSALGAHPGAEVVGVVAAAGEAASDWLGRPVIVPRLLPCGECGLCLRGRVAACPSRRRRGAPAAEETVPARFLLPLAPPLLPEPVPLGELWRWAALADALAAPHTGLCRAGQGPGELCVILGGGFRAAAAVLVVRAVGCQAVVLAPREDDRAGLSAPPFGAVAALDTDLLDPEAAREALREIAARAELPVHGPCLIETTGSDAGRARALAMVAAGGTAVLLDRVGRVGRGAADEQPDDAMAAPLSAGPALAGPAALALLCEEQGTVIGAGAPHPDLLPDLVALVLRGALDLTALTVAVAPSDIDLVLSQRRRGDVGERLRLPVARFR